MPFEVNSPANRHALRWPFELGGKGLSIARRIERYHSMLRVLFTTHKGSIVFAPEFGMSIDNVRTQTLALAGEGLAVDETEVITLFKIEAQQQVAIWIPDIQLQDISLRPRQDNERLDGKVLWGIPDAGALGSVDPREALIYGAQQTDFVY